VGTYTHTPCTHAPRHTHTSVHLLPWMAKMVSMWMRTCIKVYTHNARMRAPVALEGADGQRVVRIGHLPRLCPVRQLSQPADDLLHMALTLVIQSLWHARHTISVARLAHSSYNLCCTHTPIRKWRSTVACVTMRLQSGYTHICT